MRSAWLLAFLLIPAAAAQVTPASVETTLYLHDLGIQEFPINTQVPQRGLWSEEDYGGVGTTTLTCLDPTTGPATGGVTSQAFASYFGYSTLSFVVYDRLNGGSPLVHPTRGMAYNTTITGTPTLQWLMTPTQTLEARVGGAANVVIEATVRAPDIISPDDSFYGSGSRLMAGRTEPVTLLGSTVTGAGASQVTASEVAGQFVYTFKVPLDLQNAVIPKATGFTLRVDVRMDVPACPPGTAIMPNVLQPYSGNGLWSHLTLTNTEPLLVEPLHLQVGRGNVTFHAEVVSAWGAYDVNVPNATLTITGPMQAAAAVQETIWRTTEHFHLAEPVLQTWVLDTRDLPDGAYTAIYRVPNLQATAMAESVVTFIVTDGNVQTGPPRQAPLPLAIVLVAVAVGLALRRP